MPNDAIRLHALTRQAIEDAAPRLAAGDVAGYMAQVRAAIVRGHTAAAWSAVAQRSWTGRVRAWLGGRLGERVMPRADRERLRQTLARELAYFERFAAEAQAGELSQAQIRARAAMYAGGTRPTYYSIRYGDWEIPEALLPGNQECRSNCRCTITVEDLGGGAGKLTRSYNLEADHCSECPDLAGVYTVYRRRI